jgi:hypothetical protein
MDTNELIGHAQRLIKKLRDLMSARHGGEAAEHRPQIEGLQAQVVEFLRSYAGQHSQFARAAEEAQAYDQLLAAKLASIIEAFVDHVESGLASGISPERKGQLDVVSDLLQQAQALLSDDRTRHEGRLTWAGADGAPAILRAAAQPKRSTPSLIRRS